MALIPTHGEICKESPKTGEEACASYRLVPFLIIQISKALDALGVAVTAVATIFIALFTLALRRSTDKLWNAGEAQRALSEQTAERQLRAYVSVELFGHAKFSRDVSGNFVCEIPYKISNKGQTPALNVQIDINFIFAPQALTEDLPRPSKNAVRHSQYIVPSASYTGTAVKAFSPGKTPSDISQRLYVLGVVSYEDVFKGRRETWICSYLDQTAEFLARRASDPKVTVNATFRGAGRQNYGT
jgi:hypothetical protein